MGKIVFLVFLLLSPPLYGQGTVRIGTFMLPPFMMEVGPEKRTGGVAVEYWEKYIAPKLGLKVVAFGPFPFMRNLKMLEAGDVDVICNTTKIPEREGKFIFPPTPIGEIATCVVVPRESPLKIIRRREDLFGLRIGFLEGGYVPLLLRHDRINIELVGGADHLERCMEKVEEGRNDAFLYINHLSLLYELKERGKSGRFRIILLPEEKVKVYCIFRKTDQGRRLAEAFEKINAPLYRADTYDLLALEYVN